MSNINSKARFINSSPDMMIIFLMALFLLISQIYFAESLRAIFLYLGSFGLVICAISLSLWQSRKSIPLLLLIIFSILFWTFAYIPAINGNDDIPAYLVYAESFLHNFENTIQPLSERRMFSIGGLYAFQSPYIDIFGLKSLSFIEPVLGIIVFSLISTGKLLTDVKTENKVLAIAFVSLMPLFGSKGLANLSSSFLLSSFTFVLLVLGWYLTTKKFNSFYLFLVILIPFASATLRPTTFIFNLPIALFILSWHIYKGNVEIKKAFIITLIPFLLFLASAKTYYNSFYTYLYPIWGKGSHISSTGISITDNIELGTHFINLISTLFFDPITVLTLFLGIYCLWNRSTHIKIKTNHIYCLVIILSYFAYSFAINYATGG